MSTCKIAAAAVLTLSLGACATMKSARDRIVRAPVGCVDQTVQIYFEPDSAALTREGRAVLNLAAKDSRACKVSGVDVLGLADSAGVADANLELSKRRAQAVTEALTAAGLPAAEFKVAAAGQAGATNSKGDVRPLRRRTDVVLHLSPR
ncbi:MAG: outer membrane protein [Phenylobacterium sp.]|nr:outer membrane protein [Phenylobacterium sp.]